MVFETVSRTHVGLKRPINEDNHLVRSDAGLFVVADGMGGHEAGEVASARIVDALRALAAPEVDAIVATLGQVNEELRQMAKGGEGPRTIGSTVVGLLMSGSRFHCFWAGDSRAYRLRGGRLEQISRDHSLVQELVDAGMLEEERAHDHPNGNVITRAVGAADELRVDVVEGDIQPGDLFLLASDGITRPVPDEDLQAALSEAQPLAEIADGLVWTVLRRGAPDNLTLILLRAPEG